MKDILQIQTIRYLLLVFTATHVGSCKINTNQYQVDTSSENHGDTQSGEIQYPTITFVEIPAGEFSFGSPADTPCRAPIAETQFNVQLTRSFEMAETEVTQAQWESLGFPNPVKTSNDDEPIVFINFFEALAWCNRLSALKGLDSCYNLSTCTGDVGEGYPEDLPQSDEYGSWNAEFNFNCTGNIHKYSNYYLCPGYRLPTSAEWEYAAKANTTTHTYGGDVQYVEAGSCAVQSSLEDIAWYCANSDGVINPVKMKLSNSWGLYDTLGNVYEWTDYYFSGQSLGNADENTTLTDPIGPPIGDNIEIRGGSFMECCYVRPSRPLSTRSYIRQFDTGFRPVRTLFNDDAESDSQK
ncbi:MAG: formylglycine-generating enzyme family protein [Deltaproteobacteria bacterium]|nr:formylglycine-generating enzyme family protein [Deltaproteobacteria bacterium]